ncbi:hypothetical protein HMPREF9554_00070 [Treponema phagedenis F0421]|nr:hypothetical protein HMPREF9554_00070 [Treponema phagedenis F0421]
MQKTKLIINFKLGDFFIKIIAGFKNISKHSFFALAGRIRVTE